MVRLEHQTNVAERTIRKLTRRIAYVAFAMFVINYLDRVNIAFAALQMNSDLGFSPAMYGLGAGIFFLGYIAFEIPSNMMLRRFGSRIWLSRIMVTWGCISCVCAAIVGPRSFLALRLLLGIAEAGFFPGLIYYITLWFPARYRAKPFALLLMATAIAAIIGGPMSTFVIHQTQGWAGLAGWRWMFIIEGIPAVICGIAGLFYLVDKPSDPGWLDNEERAWLIEELACDENATPQNRPDTFLTIVRTPLIWLLAGAYLAYVASVNSIVLWLPQIIATFGSLSARQVGVVSSIPFVGALLGLVIVSRLSDRNRERRLHTGVSGLIGGCSLIASTLVNSPALSLLLLSVAAAGIWGTLAVFWTIPTTMLKGPGTAVGIAMINAVAQCGGFFGPIMIGLIREATGSFTLALVALASTPMAAFVALMVAPRLQGGALASTLKSPEYDATAPV